jgi:hypothetical protein
VVNSVRKLCKTIGVDKKPREMRAFRQLNAANRDLFTTLKNKTDFVCLKFTIMSLSRTALFEIVMLRGMNPLNSLLDGHPNGIARGKNT